MSKRADLWVEHRGGFEPVDIEMNERHLILGSSLALRLDQIKVDSHDEFTLQLSEVSTALPLTDERIYLVRVPSLAHRDSLVNEIKREIRIVQENRLVEEADEIIAAFEERLYDDIPS